MQPRRVIDFLAPLGFVVIIGSQALLRANKPLPGRPEIYLIAGAALVLAHIILRWEQIVGRVGRRQLRHGSNSLVLGVVVLGILGVVNYLVERHTKRWDLTKSQRYSLSDQTRKVVQGLKTDVKIHYFQNWLDPSAFQAVKDRLREYELLSSHLKVEYLDHRKDRRRAEEYDITVVPTLVVERGDRREKITSDSEQEVTNALIKVTREQKKTVCFVEGEGERSAEDSGERGYSGVKAALGRGGYETKNVRLLGQETVPEGCTVLVMAGPEKDPMPPVIEMVRGYVKKGGKAMLLVEPDIKESYPQLEALLAEWNIEAGKDVIVDRYGEAARIGAFAPIGGRYPYHEITKDFRLPTAFLMARSVQAGKASIEGVTAQNLVETSPDAELAGRVLTWAETDLKSREARFEEGKDRKGPVSLAAAVTLKVAEDKAAPSPSPAPAAEAAPEKKGVEGRVVAVGDSDFASNGLLPYPGNMDFFLNSVAWLAQESDLISIRAKDADDQRMFLTGPQRQSVFLLALVVLPGAFVVMGIAAWWRRR